MKDIPPARPGRKENPDPLASAKIRAAAIAATRGMPAETPLSIAEMGVIVGATPRALAQRKYSGTLGVPVHRIGASNYVRLGDVREVYLGIPREGA